MISKHSKGAFKKLTKEFGVSVSNLDDYIEAAQFVDGHNVFYELSKCLHQPKEMIESRFVQCAVAKGRSEVGKIVRHVQQFLV